MGGWVSGEKALWDYQGAEQFETASRCTPTQGDGGCSIFGNV